MKRHILFKSNGENEKKFIDICDWNLYDIGIKTTWEMFEIFKPINNNNNFNSVTCIQHANTWELCNLIRKYI